MSTDHLSIRLAREADIPGILEIYNDAILNTTALYTYEPFTAAMMQQWFADKQAKNLPVFVVAPENKITGFASYGPFRPWPAYKYSVEHSIYVHKDHRGKGIAIGLLSTLIDHATAANLHTIVAGIDSKNAVSINLHKKFGFKETARINEVGYKFGRWLDLVFMQLILNNNLQPDEK